jgi:hypothetical protein
MDPHQLGQLPLYTGYMFESGAPFYEKLGDERAAALLKALEADGYRIVRVRDVSIGRSAPPGRAFDADRAHPGRRRA